MESALSGHHTKECAMSMSHNWFSRIARYILGGSSITFSGDEKGHLRVSMVLGIFAESVKKFPWTTIGIILLTVAASAVSIVAPLYYKEFFNITTRGLSASETGGLLISAVLAICVFNLLHMASEWSARFLLVRLSKNVMIDLRLRAFNHLIGHSHAFFAESFSGALVQRLARIVRSYDRIADSIVFHILPASVTVVGVVIVLWNESRVLAYAVLVWVALLIFVSYLFARWKLRYDVLRSELDSKVTAVTADILTNQPAVEAHGSHEYEKQRHEKVVREQFTVAAFTWRLGMTFGAVQHTAIIALEFLTFFIGVGLWMRGEFPLSMFFLVYLYVFRITEKLWPFSQVVRDVYESFAEAKEPAEIMSKPHDVIESTNAKVLENVKGEIEFRNVSFAYKGRVVLDIQQLHICAGARVALVGPSGAGKSTLTKLLLRLCDAKSGTVSIDGIDVRDATLASLKQAMSIVPQDPVLFHLSLRENIRYGKVNATDEEVIAAAKLAHCHDFISALPEGYETLVGERGIKLSGGERQRVAIARAFLRNAPILVLDEATSSLDSLSESFVQEALNRLMHNRTTLIIAHRLSTIRNMQRIIVLDEGRIIEDGSHQSLLDEDGLYAKLWRLQQSGFTLEGNAEEEKSPILA